MMIKRSRLVITALLVGMSPVAAMANTLFTPASIEAMNSLDAAHSALTMQAKAEQNNFNQFLQGLTDFIRRLDAADQANKFAAQTSPVAQLGGGGCADSGAGAMARKPAPLSASVVPSVAGGSAPLPSSAFAQQSKLVSDQALWSLPGKPLPVFSPNATDAATQAYIDTLITPHQPTALGGDEESTPAGVAWKAGINEMTAPVSLAETSMQLVAGYNRAINVSADELSNIQQILSITGSAQAQPAIWSSDNLMDYIVTGIYANENWQKWINAAPDAGVHRALALMTALSLKQEQQRNELMAQLAALSAAKTAMASQNLVGKLNSDKTVATDQAAR